MAGCKVLTAKFDALLRKHDVIVNFAVPEDKSG